MVKRVRQASLLPKNPRLSNDEVITGITTYGLKGTYKQALS